MGFDAELTNPKPKGTIKTTGSFGPWQTADPGESPLSGDYRLEHADLASFKGIAGILDSTGHYQGTLRNLTVDGQADVPDFRLYALRECAAARDALPCASRRDQRRHAAGAGGCDAGPLALYRAGRDRAPAGSGDRGRATVWRPRDCADGERGSRGGSRTFLRLASHSDKVLLTGDVSGEDHARHSSGACARA